MGLDPDSPLIIRMIDPVVAVGVWLIGNLLIWLALFELPFLRHVPPALLGITGIFANFYLIAFARHTGKRCRKRIEMARAPVPPQ
jgi:hypothetical protein